MKHVKHFQPDTGSMLVSIMILMSFLAIFVFGLMTLGRSNMSRASDRILALQAQYAAESGADAALAYLNIPDSSGEEYEGEDDVLVVENGSRYRAEYDVEVKTPNDAAGVPMTNERIILATGNVYMPASSLTPEITRKVEVVAKRSSDFTSKNILSRNIVHIASAVKDVIAKDIFVNNYIQMDKNVNNFIADSITIADRNPSAENCSISGGKLSKPASTGRTVLRLAYNNCSTLSGGAGNFDIQENQNDIEKVQSTFIPWQFGMHPTTVTPGLCSHWTSGGSLRDIPYGSDPFTPAQDAEKNNNTVHYPDSDTGTIDSCEGGSIDLGNATININQSVHVRADLCSNSPCKPTFNNPTQETRYVFVEGTINFEQLLNVDGSGPIVFISYGTDPSELSSICPDGGAVRLGQQGNSNTDAPRVFLLAINGGMCLDGTKFASDRALGGVSGKNLYIATNSGTPFNLAFDPDFPVEDVPVNLTFKATQYRRIY